MNIAPAITLQLFGAIDLRGCDRVAADELLSQPKTVALLACLAIPITGRLVRRDHLVGLLWPEADQSHARTALRKRIHAIRTALGADVLLARGDEEIGIAPEQLWCDVSEFTNAADSAELMQALKLYRGALMPGFHLSGAVEFGQWLDQERRDSTERAAAAAWALAQRLEHEQELSAAGRWARRAVRFASTDERALRRALLMLQRLGDRAGALHLFAEFERELRMELDIAPSLETIACVNGIRETP